MNPHLILTLFMNRLPKPRKVLECASPLALLESMRRLKVAEDCRLYEYMQEIE